MLLHLQFPLPLRANRPPLLPHPPPRWAHRVLPYLLPDPHAVQKRLPDAWPLLQPRLLNGSCGVLGTDWVLANWGCAGLVSDLPIWMRGFEDSKDGGVGFLLCGFRSFGALGELGCCCFFGRSHGHWWGGRDKRPEVPGEFLDVDVEVILRLDIEVGCFGVGGGSLGDRSAEVGFLLLLLVSGLRGDFEALDCGGDGVDDVCRVGFLLLFGAKDGGECAFGG